MKQEIVELLNSGVQTEEHPLDRLMKQASVYLLQVALEKELTEFLGRGHYQRGHRRQSGWRNGYEPKRIRTAQGMLTLSQPQVRESQEAFSSRLADTLGRRSPNLEALATRMWVRGLSTRDVEALFLETLGERVLSKSGVSEVSETLKQEFDTWRQRDLSGLKIVYLFLDAIYLPVRQGCKEQEGVLCAYGITEEGKKALLHLALGSRESYDAWLSFLHEMTARGLAEPVLVISDGNPGLLKAIRQVFPNALRQRCQVHRMRNILAKLPKAVIAQTKRLIQQVFLAPTYERGLARGKALIVRFRDRYPSAMEALEKDLEATLTYLNFPKEHHKSIRTTNLLERTFGEGRRRTKVIPRFPTETSCLKLVFATLITASKNWRGLTMSPKILRQLDAIRQELLSQRKMIAA
ncbi:MAG: IS256 family transposase [Nitrospiraceae bacterium]